jgi:nucleotide-binding universal stress UspA family protein
MKTILVPTDFSSAADNALSVAVSLAERTGATIKVLHIVEGIYEGDFNSSGALSARDTMDDVFILKMIEKAKAQLKKELGKFDLKGLKVETDVVVGGVFVSISSIIASGKIDLIVMGTHSKSENVHHAGSNTIKVVKKAHCPVLVVKNRYENFAVRKVLFATDYSTVNASYIDQIKQLREYLGFEIYVLFVNTQLNFLSTADINKLKEEFKNRYNLNDAKYDFINSYSEEEGIREYASAINADLVALTTHGRKGINLFFFGSVSENIVEESERPILTFKID